MSDSSSVVWSLRGQRRGRRGESPLQDRVGVRPAECLSVDGAPHERARVTSGVAVRGVRTLRRTSAEAPVRRAPCLTEVRTSLLIASALGVSAILWLAILRVI